MVCAFWIIELFHLPQGRLGLGLGDNLYMIDGDTSSVSFVFFCCCCLMLSAKFQVAKHKSFKIQDGCIGICSYSEIYTSQLSYISAIHITDYIPCGTGEFGTPKAL